MRFLLLISVVTWHVTSSAVMDDSAKKAAGLQAVTQSANTFAPKFFSKVSESAKGNVICSPLSASMVLSMAAYGANKKTATEMRSVLALPQDDSVAKTGFQTLIDNFKNYKKVDLQIANKMFVAENFSVKPDFKKMIEKDFRSDVQNLNFAKAPEAVQVMNKWCEDHTNKRIKDLFKPDSVDGSTALVLANAVYFKGNWSNKFLPSNTEPRPFFVNGVTEKKVPTMFRHGSYRYGKLEDVNATFIELPYEHSGEDDAISMFIVLPDKKDGLKELEKNIDKVTMDRLSGGRTQDVNVYLPRFKIESDIQLNDVLDKMGMGEMFRDTADFTGIADAPPLKVSKVVQKAFIEVNEEGSEAAAASGAVMVMRGRPAPMNPPIDFRVDRPVYIIIAAKCVELFTCKLASP